MNAGVDLVTGGAGFIGSELVALLVAAGRRVVVLDDLSAGREAYLDGLPPARCTLVRGTILDRGLVQTLVGGSERVFHLAARGLRQSIHDPEPVHAVNATGTLILLEAARRAGIERFVHVSSSEVYGPARTAPMDETLPTYPTTPYGASKLAGEAYARSAFITHGLPVVVVRPFNVFGPRSHHEGASGEVIPRFMLRALANQNLIVFGDGMQTRDFTYVADMARAILLAGDADAAVGETVNVGSGAEISISDLARLVARTVGAQDASIVHQADRPGDVSRLLCDNRKARRLLGWTAETGLAAGLTLLRRWYATQPYTPERMLADEIVRNWEPVSA